MKVLVIEDNDILRANICKYLEIKGHQVIQYQTFKGATYTIMTQDHDIVILDLGLGSNDGDGIDICREVREKGNTIPILILTARNLILQKIEGLNSGADDYMTKPFDYEELLARLHAMVRRDNSLKGEVMKYKNIIVYTNEMKVEQNKTEISLSKLEYNLLVHFMQHQQQVLTKESIMQHVWGEIDMFKENRNVDIYVGYLRKKLGKDIIETVRGAGYIMNP